MAPEDNLAAAQDSDQGTQEARLHSLSAEEDTEGPRPEVAEAGIQAVHSKLVAVVAAPLGHQVEEEHPVVVERPQLVLPEPRLERPLEPVVEQEQLLSLLPSRPWSHSFRTWSGSLNEVQLGATRVGSENLCQGAYVSMTVNQKRTSRPQRTLSSVLTSVSSLSRNECLGYPNDSIVKPFGISSEEIVFVLWCVVAGKASQAVSIASALGNPEAGFPATQLEGLAIVSYKIWFILNLQIRGLYENYLRG